MMELVSVKDRSKNENVANGYDYYQREESPNTGQDQSLGTKEEKDSLSDFQAVMLLIPVYIGIGFLGLPYAVKLVGLWAGSIGLFVYGILNEGCVLLLTDCAQNLTERTGKSPEDIAGIVEMSTAIGPSWLQRHATKLRVIVNAVVLFVFLVLLLDFLSIMTAFAQDFLGKYMEVNRSLLILVISTLLIPIYLTKRMKMLAWMSTVANICTLSIFVITFPYLVTDLPDQSTRPAVKYPNFLAVTTFSNDAIFSYGSIAMVLPIRDRLRSTKTFQGWTGVLGVVLMFVTCFHVACGFYGYLKFGEALQATYLLNLPQESVLMTVLKVLFFLSMYCSTGVSIFVPVDTIWGYIRTKWSSEFSNTYGEYIIRCFLLILVCLSTILIPDFEILMPLAGFGLFCFVMIIPGYIKICSLYGEADPQTWTGKVKRLATLTICYGLVVSGIYLAVSGLVVSLYMAAGRIIL